MNRAEHPFYGITRPLRSVEGGAGFLGNFGRPARSAISANVFELKESTPVAHGPGSGQLTPNPPGARKSRHPSEATAASRRSQFRTSLVSMLRCCRVLPCEKTQPTSDVALHPPKTVRRSGPRSGPGGCRLAPANQAATSSSVGTMTPTSRHELAIDRSARHCFGVS